MNLLARNNINLPVVSKSVPVVFGASIPPALLAGFVLINDTGFTRSSVC